MKIIRNSEETPETPSIVTFGVFDGLHLGHQLIMRSVVDRARETGFAPTVVTFDPHPRAVLHPESAPPLLQTFVQKMNGLEQLGISQTIVLKFDEELSRVSAVDFLRGSIFGRLDAREVFLGHGFAFGHNREGNFDLLMRTAASLGRKAIEAPEVMLRKQRVSSTMIRRLLSAGRVNLARRMLGRPYGVESRVIEGRKIARTQLDYATANLKPHNCVLPAAGVYVTLTFVDAQWRRSISNVGYKPTFGGDAEVTLESHVMDFSREIYGEKIQVRFLHRIRNEIKFESVDILRAQIARDYAVAEQYFKSALVSRTLQFL